MDQTVLISDLGNYTILPLPFDNKMKYRAPVLYPGFGGVHATHLFCFLICVFDVMCQHCV
jgi:hypothetical protein